MFGLEAAIALIIDKLHGEFKFIKHPIISIGDFIKYFEKNFYSDSKSSGFYLLIATTVVSLFATQIVLQILDLFPDLLNTIFVGVIGSIFLAHYMLYHCVKEAVDEGNLENKREKLQMLVSRDTKDLETSEINKALIETYSENLSDGVVAPLFYFLLFGLSGLVFYKAVNTLDSMVGYKTERYKNFGFFSAKLDDILNYIPSRITMLFITLKSLKPIFLNAKKHESPNAGYPITAMAYKLDISLGGDTKYFGEIKKKPKFGIGREKIFDADVRKMLQLRSTIDIKLIGVCFVCSMF